MIKILYKLSFAIVLVLITLTGLILILRHSGFGLNVLTGAYYFSVMGTSLLLWSHVRNKMTHKRPFLVFKKGEKLSVKEFFLVLIPTSIVFFYLLLPGFHLANDLHFSFHKELADQFRLPQAWGVRGAEGMGESAIFLLWTWPFTFIISFLNVLGLSFNTIIIIGFITALSVASCGMIKLLKGLGVNKYGIVAGTLTFVINTYFVLLLDGGQLSIALAYAFLPWVFVAFNESLFSRVTKKIKSGFFMGILGFLDIRFVYILFIILVVQFVVSFLLNRTSLKGELLREWAKSTGIAAIILIGINSYWLLPLLLYHNYSPPSSYINPSQGLGSFSTIGNSLSILQPHWYKNIFGLLTNLKPEFLVLPFLAFLSPLFTKYKRKVLLFLIIGLIGIFLSKGENLPFGFVYRFLFTHFPGFSLFRDSTKFYILITLSYSVLLAFLFDFLNSKMKHGKLFVVAFGIYLVAIMNPAWQKLLTGTFSSIPYQSEYLKLSQDLESDSSFGRVLWLPTKAPLGYSTPNHPSLEGLRIADKRSFAVGRVGQYEAFNFLREYPYIDDLLRIAGIKYIAYPYPDERRTELKKDNVAYYYTFLDQLSSKDWIKYVVSNSPLPVLQLKQDPQRFFVTSNTFAIIGSEKVYNDIFWGAYKNQNSAIFLEEGKETFIKDLHFTRILNTKGRLDVIAAFIPQDLYITPGKNLTSNPDKSGWWRWSDFLTFRNFLHDKYQIDNDDFDYSRGYALSEGETTLEIPVNRNTNDFKILARVLKSSRGGIVDFYQGDEKIGSINSQFINPPIMQIKLTGNQNVSDQIFDYSTSEFMWFDIGKVVSKEPLLIKTDADLTVINTLIFVSEDELAHTSDVIDWNKVLSWQHLNDFQKEEILSANEFQESSVDYERLSSTHFKLTVTGLRNPSTLAFSETYDPRWKLRSQDGLQTSSYPLFSLINGFYIEKDGIYDVYYSPQKYVDIGFKLSLTFILSLFVTVLLLKPKENV